MIFQFILLFLLIIIIGYLYKSITGSGEKNYYKFFNK